MTKHHDLLTTDPTDLYDEMQRPLIPARLHLDAVRRHIMARPSLVETADKLDATQQLVDELSERLAAAQTMASLWKAKAREYRDDKRDDKHDYDMLLVERDRLREELAAVKLDAHYAINVVKEQVANFTTLHGRYNRLRAALLEIISRPGEAEQVARLAVMEDGQS